MTASIRFFRVFAVLAVVLTLAACTSSVPMASSAENAEGKSFSTPPPGMAALYIFRSAAGLGGGEVVFTPTIGQRVLGGLAPSTWLRVDLPAGRHDLRCLGGENQGNLALSLAPQEVKFVKIDVGSGWANYRCHFVEVDAAMGRDEILRGNRAQDIR